MQAAQFRKPFHSKMDNWKYGSRNPAWHDPKAIRRCMFCAFMATQTALSVGPLLRPRCGMTVQSKSGERIIPDLAAALGRRRFPRVGPRRSKIGPAALAAFDELKRHAIDRPIVPFGTSIGATATLHIAAQRPVVGVVLKNPPPLREMILRRFGWWNLWLLAGPVALQIPKDLDSIANAKAIHAPAIFLLAEKDAVVPPRYHKLVVDAYAGEKHVIQLPGAHHNDPIEGTALADFNRGIDWLLAKKLLLPAL